MKKLLCILLALTMLFCLASCNGNEGDGADKDTDNKQEEAAPKKVEGDLDEIYEKLNEKIDIASTVSYAQSMATDEDQDMLLFNFELPDSEIEASEKITDYIFTMPTDYCTTFMAFIFDEGMPSEEEIDEFKQHIKEISLDPRVSALQMYAPEEYEKMNWASENTDLIWRQYDNALVLIITGDREATEAFEAFEEIAVK